MLFQSQSVTRCPGSCEHCLKEEAARLAEGPVNLHCGIWDTKCACYDRGGLQAALERGRYDLLNAALMQGRSCCHSLP